MKKLVLFLLIASALSCKHQNDVTPIQKNFTGGTPRALAGGDGAYDVLGYGIDATLDPDNPNSVSASPILDVSRFATDYASQLSSYINKDNATAQVDSFYYGSNAVSYSNQLTVAKGLNVSLSSDGGTTANKDPNATSNGGSVTANVGNEGTQGASGAKTSTTGGTPKPGASTTSSGDLFTLSYSRNTNDVSSAAYSSNYSYASEEITEKIRRLAFTGDVTVNMLMNYLTPAFVNDVNTLSADALVARYGTHVLLDISLGGVFRFNYSAITNDQTNTANNTTDMQIGLGVSVLKTVGVNLNYTNDQNQVTTVMNATQKKSFSLQFYGGLTSGLTTTFDANGNPSQTLNIGNWESSINANNCAVVDIGNALYLSDFIADPVKKAAVLAAIQAHIAAAQVTTTTPIISTWYPGTIVLSARGQAVYSQNKQYELTLQGDGNFLLLNASSGAVLWASNKYDSNGGGANQIVMQADGNLVGNSATSTVWADNFYWKNMNLTGSTFIFYTLQNDGNLVLYNNTEAIAATQTNGGQKSTHFGTLKSMISGFSGGDLTNVVK